MARPLRLVLLAAVCLLAATSCAEEPPAAAVPTTAPPSATPTLPPPGVDCPTEAARGLTIRLTNAAGYSIAAVDLGAVAVRDAVPGPTSAVVLAHQSQGSLCEWLPYGEVLAARGYRVLAFDFAGSGSSTVPQQKTYVEDVRAAVTYLREQGVTKVVIIGASMGATMSVVAAAAIAPPVDGVIALSPPVTFDGINAERAAPSLRSPALYVAGDTDGDYAEYARAINTATPADQRHLLVVSTPHHGIRLIDSEVQATVFVRNAVEQFLYKNAPLSN